MEKNSYFFLKAYTFKEVITFREIYEDETGSRIRFIQKQGDCVKFYQE
jgi:hypothetical protein